MVKKLAFLSGTRADYGKLKPILKTIHERNGMVLHVFVTGMHMLEQFGNTYVEVVKDGLGQVFCDEDYRPEPRMDMALANVIRHFSRFVRVARPDMIVVHGDRLEALAGALVGAFNNILVAHIEGGEVSGTIDESIRHGVSKFAHLHFVANEEAEKRLIQLGEARENIYVIGSPDVDVMLSGNLPSLDEVRQCYDIPFAAYAILLYHPVVTEIERIPDQVKILLDALLASGRNYVVIYPNNDPGNEIIRRAYEGLSASGRFHVLPSMRFERFLTLLKNAEFIVGNSSAGIREACVYGTPAVDVGSRQRSRYNMKVLKNVFHVSHDRAEIIQAIADAPSRRHQCLHFGSGGSAEAFYEILQQDSVWRIPSQKHFLDVAFEVAQ
jgi:UDP-N-acetylglucosamine 2-epimerase (hydrolysing)